MILPELAEALVDTGPELCDWLETSTPLQLRLVPGFPDYHPEHPGGKPRGGRSLEPRALRVLAPRGVGRPHGRHAAAHARDRDADRRRHRRRWTPRRPSSASARACEGLGRAHGGRAAARLPGPRRRARARSTGRSTCVDGRRRRGRGPASRRPTGRVEVGARAVVLATGGFEYDQDLVRDFLRGPIRHPAGVPTNTGDGLRMAMRDRRASSATCARPGGSRSPRCPAPTPTTTSRSCWCCASGPCRGRSWSTASAPGSPTRRPTTTPSAAPSTSSTRPRSATSTSPAGWSSTRASSTGTAASATAAGRTVAGLGAPRRRPAVAGRADRRPRRRARGDGRRGSTGSPRRATTTTSAAGTAPTTAGAATGRPTRARRPRWARWTRRPSTPSS